LGAHPALRTSAYAERVLRFVHASDYRGASLFATLQAVAAFDLPIAREFIRDGLSRVASRQRRNGTFGTPCPIERVAAVLVAQKALQ
jgi:hypothetical protein